MGRSAVPHLRAFVGCPLRGGAPYESAVEKKASKKLAPKLHQRKLFAAPRRCGQAKALLLASDRRHHLPLTGLGLINGDGTVLDVALVIESHLTGDAGIMRLADLRQVLLGIG